MIKLITNQIAHNNVVYFQEPSHKDRGALPHLIAEDMMVMSDFELHKCCLFYKVY
ncbi:hypothetical protein DPMN_061475 [Dreissena polymorpha]|uniref:Uncharacterized protein n=1 Tax=Dreissena polymorpha TaxID=45954 RepID=A0A9D4HIF7_DREPO|nr:hypothetical protein DPMN_061475 [Dreissena polymorpha]